MSQLWHYHTAPSPLSGHIRLKIGFPFPSPPPSLEEVEGRSTLEEVVASAGRAVGGGHREGTTLRLCGWGKPGKKV